MRTVGIGDVEREGAYQRASLFRRPSLWSAPRLRVCRNAAARPRRLLIDRPWVGAVARRGGMSRRGRRNGTRSYGGALCRTPSLTDFPFDHAPGTAYKI